MLAPVVSWHDASTAPIPRPAMRFLVTNASRLLLGWVVYQHAGVLLHIVVLEHQVLG
jgi:hypothetical protein